MADDVILNKAVLLNDNEQNLVGNLTKQDAIVLNFSVPVKRLSIWPCMW